MPSVVAWRLLRLKRNSAMKRLRENVRNFDFVIRMIYSAPYVRCFPRKILNQMSENNLSCARLF